LCKGVLPLHISMGNKNMTNSSLNKSVVKEIRNVFYKTCDANRLSDKDLLIMVLEPLIGDRYLSKVADEILDKGLPYLATLSEFELSTLFGLDEKQSFHLMTVFELSRRVNLVQRDDEVVIRSPEDIAKLCCDIQFYEKEHFVQIYLNTKNGVIGRETISVGSLNSAIVHPREVFRAAIRRGAASVIFVHNHPSTDPSPSSEDIQLTSRLVEAGQLIGIEVLDHVIVGGERHLSLKQLGHM
jgi:DNA repair protein RadC